VLVTVSLGSIPATGGVKHSNKAKAPMTQRINPSVRELRTPPVLPLRWKHTQVVKTYYDKVRTKL